MGLFSLFTPQSPEIAKLAASQTPVSESEKQTNDETTKVTPAANPPNPIDIPLPQSPPPTSASTEASNGYVDMTPDDGKRPSVARVRRFSFKTFSYVYADSNGHKPHELSAIKEHEKKERAARALTKQLAKPLTATSDRKAKESAMMVRSLIIGPTANVASPQVTKAVAKPQLRKLKSELMHTKSANKVIAQLRALPVLDEVVGKDGKSIVVGDSARGPIHAVCLAHNEAEVDALHFSKLTAEPQDNQLAVESLSITGLANTSIDKLTSMFNDMRLVQLVKAPNLGLGEPGDGEGILAGAVPTAETVIKGIEQITPQLMALGFATGRAVLPDHKGVYPPTDRMSVLTYWWGLEIALPPPSLVYLANAQSISNSLMNFLSAIALINNGVREILPFVRYISQFIDFEFKAIQAQNRGQGVVCAATWIMPAALVPRPWDFPPPPEESTPTNEEKASNKPRSQPTPSQELPPLTLPPATPPLPTLVVTSPTESADSVPAAGEPFSQTT